MTDILALIGVTDARSLGVLSPAFDVVQQMSDIYRHIKLGRKRCKDIVQRAALIIKGIHANLQRGQSIPDMARLRPKLEEVQTILQAIADMSFFKALLHFEDINKSIERAYTHLSECSQLFPMVTLSSQAQAQSKATLSDRELLRDLLKILAGNYEEIRRRFGIYNDEQEDQVMAVMERELKNAKVASQEDMPVEMQIMQKSLECIKATTGRSAPKRNKWLITEYDLEYCGTIGGGGFATVKKARFRYTMVAVKTFKDSAGNMREALEREVEIWSRLHHDHIVPFYGASILTSPPFIVSRYMQNGNLVQYLAATPNADRTKLTFEVSLGMYYLHEEDVVHGDLKAVNVLVDDSGKACITDFGLSKICSSGSTVTEPGKVAGTLRFLAPEALRGEPLSFETDVYAFGMLIYEVFTGEVPLIRESDEMILEGRVELQRPTSSQVHEHGFNDALWQLLSESISRKPSARPRFKTIQACLFSFMKTEPSSQSVHPDPIPGPEDKHLTNWELDTQPIAYPSRTLISNPPPHLRKVHSSLGEQPRISSRESIPYSLKTLPPIFPVCIEVTHRYFGVKFGVSSREPGVYLEETNTFQWQPIKSKKGSLLYEEVNKFWYKSAAGSGNNSWELNGNDVTLHTLANAGVCHFKDTKTAQKWFKLQVNYARDGSVGDWGSAMGDWFYTEQGWRRLASGKLQQANLAEGAPNAVPPDNTWSDINLPKRCVIDGYAGTENCIVCTTNPGKQPGRLCCKREGRRIVFETYRRQGDKEPMTAREETYPSEEYAQTTLNVLRVALERAAEKSNKTGFFSF